MPPAERACGLHCDANARGCACLDVFCLAAGDAAACAGESERAVGGTLLADCGVVVVLRACDVCLNDRRVSLQR